MYRLVMILDSSSDANSWPSSKHLDQLCTWSLVYFKAPFFVVSELVSVSICIARTWLVSLSFSFWNLKNIRIGSLVIFSARYTPLGSLKILRRFLMVPWHLLVGNKDSVRLVKLRCWNPWRILVNNILRKHLLGLNTICLESIQRN